MKKIRSAEFLAAIAIVTSAAVMQIREHVQAHDAPPANAQASLPACTTAHDGFTPAGCEATRGEGQVEHALPSQHDARRQIWV